MLQYIVVTFVCTTMYIYLPLLGMLTYSSLTVNYICDCYYLHVAELCVDGLVVFTDLCTHLLNRDIFFCIPSIHS